MKLTTYTLNPDGSVPEYVNDGGYFPAATAAPSPQDWVMLGVTIDDAPGATFENVDALEEYLLSIGADSWLDPQYQPLNVPEQAAALWARL